VLLGIKATSENDAPEGRRLVKYAFWLPDRVSQLPVLFVIVGVPVVI
jgi:hypothetical protein